MIRFENVSKVFKDEFVALRGINLEVQEGEFVSLVGPSGAGKSTLLKMIYAEVRPSEGEVYFNELPLSEIKKNNLAYHRRAIGTVFQEFKLLPKKTAFENVAYALEVAGAPREEIEQDVAEILDIVGLKDKSSKFPFEISGGERQRVAIARALINKPMVIVADEPTGNLDPVSSVDILRLLLKINELGTTVILATHDKEIVNQAQKRVISMDHGKIVNDHKKGKYAVT